MSENQKKVNKSILGDTLNFDTLINTTTQSNDNSDSLINLAGNLMQNPDTMNSLMKVASSLFTNNAIVNSVNEMNNPKQDQPAPDTAPAQENTELSLISSQLEKLANELSKIKSQLNELSEIKSQLNELSEVKSQLNELNKQNKQLIKYTSNSNKNSRKK